MAAVAERPRGSAHPSGNGSYRHRLGFLSTAGPTPGSVPPGGMRLTRFWHHDRSRRLNAHLVEASASTRDAHERQRRVRALKNPTHRANW